MIPFFFSVSSMSALKSPPALISATRFLSRSISACTSASQAIGYAYEAIRSGRQHMMIAGGAEELCPSQAMAFGNEYTHILSTEGMVKFAEQSDKERFLIATEVGILHRLRKEVPGKRFDPVKEEASCKFMKMITLVKLRDALRDEKFVVTVDPEIADRARGAIERMVAIG